MELSHRRRRLSLTLSFEDRETEEKNPKILKMRDDPIIQGRKWGADYIDITKKSKKIQKNH